ncbi:MAG: hypothetical protein ABI746_03785 [Dermatophilaceae bacterium]
MERRYRLVAGQVGPAQQSSLSCGAACLAVARMLCDPMVSRWVLDGVDGARRRPTRAGEGPAERFARLERHIQRRTNSMLSYPGRVQPPWPRALGTSPWGALAELERHGAVDSSRYEMLVARHLDATALGQLFDNVVARLRPGSPALLYVGNELAPRHVCLMFRDSASGAVLVYEPSSGAVVLPSREAFARGRLALGGWDRAWFVLVPGARSPVGAAMRWLLSAPIAPTARRLPGTAMIEASGADR